MMEVLAICPSSWVISVAYLLLNLIISAPAQMSREVTFNLQDETPRNYFIGNILKYTTIAATDSYPVVFDDYNFPKLTRFFHLSDTGNITVTEHLDRDNQNDVCGPLNCCDEAICTIKFLAVFEKKGDRQKVWVKILVMDSNDNAPTFANNEIDTFIDEGKNIPNINSIGFATDKDSYNYQVKRYELIDKNNIFRLADPSRTEIEVTRSLDYDGDPNARSFSVTLHAIDGGKPAKTGSLGVTIHLQDVNDNRPAFSEYNKIIVINENPPKDFILPDTPKATDADSNANGEVVYSIGGATSSYQIFSKFKINPDTGDIMVIDNLDYEKISERKFLLPIVAQDRGKPIRSTTATVTVVLRDINDNYPHIEVERKNSVAEGSPAGVQVLRFYVLDDDNVSRNKVKCHSSRSKGLTLKNVSGGTSFFVQTNAVFDYELEHFVWIEIYCIDSAEPPLRKVYNLTVSVTDINDNFPVFNQSVYYRSLPENEKPNTPILRAQAFDADSGQYGKLKYSLDYRGQNYFRIDEQTGDIFVLNGIDREEVSQITFTVTAKDGGGKSAFSHANISILDVNDNAPTLSSDPDLVVVENSPTGKYIGTLHFKDPDYEDNGRIVIESLEENPSSVRRFLHLKPNGDLVTQQPVDREKHANLFMKVLARDHGKPQQSTTVTISIRVQDENDNPPELSYPIRGTTVGYTPSSIYTNSPTKTKVVTLVGADPDQGENGTIRFQLKQTTNASHFFHLDSKGTLYTTWNNVNQPKVGVYEVEVLLHDLGNPQQSSLRRFLVNVASAIDMTMNTTPDGPSTGSLSNVVILVLIIVLSIFLGTALIAAIVWARSRVVHRGGSAYTDYSLHKVPNEVNCPVPVGYGDPNHPDVHPPYDSVVKLSSEEPSVYPPYKISGSSINGTLQSTMTTNSKDYSYHVGSSGFHQSALSNQPLSPHYAEMQPLQSKVYPSKFPTLPHKRNSEEPVMVRYGDSDSNPNYIGVYRYGDTAFSDSGRGASLEDIHKYNHLTSTTSFTNSSNPSNCNSVLFTTKYYGAKRHPDEGTIC